MKLKARPRIRFNYKKIANKGENVNYTYYLETRTQHAKSGRRGFSGPDMYVAVVAVPDGVECPYYLNRKVLRMRGIKLYYFGEGYSRYCGDRSLLGKAITEARDFIRNEEHIQNCWREVKPEYY